jgi:hypothetical protein
MFDNFHVWIFRAIGSQHLPKAVSLLTVSFLFVFFSSACAHIELQPGKKDTQLLSLEQFARDATVHLMSTDPKTYEHFQLELIEEITPGVLSQLKARGACAKSPAEIKARVQALSKTNTTCVVRIEGADFPAKATQNGLVPIEVHGMVLTKIGSKPEKPAKFDLVYLVGTNKSTQKPIIASIQIK